MFIFYLLIGAPNPEESYFNVRLIYGPSVMLLIFYIYPCLNRFKIKNFIQRAGKQSLYIYLLHFFVLYWLTIIINTFNLNYINPYLLFVSFIFLGFFITYFLIIMVQKAYNSLINKNHTI